MSVSFRACHCPSLCRSQASPRLPSRRVDGGQGVGSDERVIHWLADRAEVHSTSGRKGDGWMKGRASIHAALRHAEHTQRMPVSLRTWWPVRWRAERMPWLSTLYSRRTARRHTRATFVQGPPTQAMRSHCFAPSRRGWPHMSKPPTVLTSQSIAGLGVEGKGQA